MEIECEFFDIEWNLITPKAVYCCEVTQCSIKTRGKGVSAFKGQHKPEKNNNSVKALWIHNTRVHYMPRNLTQIFPNLIYLAVESCELKRISAEDMIGLEKLEDFNLHDNHIETLPVDLFKNMINLKEVSFNGNLIQEFDTEVLQPIVNTIAYFGLMDNPGSNNAFNKKQACIDVFIERLQMFKSKKKDSKRFDDLFTSGKHSDFTIEVLRKKYKVHKCILASMSSVFDKMFSDNAVLATKTFDDTKNFSQTAIEEFLNYFYTRNRPSKRNASELLQLAVEFDVPDLKMDCESTLVETMYSQTPRNMYNLAVQHSLPKLKRKAFDAIKRQHLEAGEFMYEKPKLVNMLIDAKDEFEAKKIKLERSKRID